MTAEPANIKAGQSTALHWTSTNATGCTASGGWSGEQGVNGSLAQTPASSTQYGLSCTGSGGTAQTSVAVNVADPQPGAPTVSLSASPATVAAGGEFTLTWNSTDATSCVAGDAWSGSQALSGSLALSPAATATYSLTCSGAGGSAQSSVVVTVSAVPPPPAPTLTLHANPASVQSGQSSTLTWSSTNTNSCTASGGWSGTQPASGSMGVKPTATTAYALSCSGAGGAVSASVSVSVNAAPLPSLTFSVSPAHVAAGGSAMLQWSSTNATGCTASGGWTGAVSAQGSSVQKPQATSQYTLSCTGAGGSSPARSVTVTVDPAPALTFAASPASITAGGTSTLNWTATNATGCTASGGSFTGSRAVSGSQGVAPTANTTYTMSCIGAGGTIVKTAAVAVKSAAPTLSFSASPASITSGGSSTLSWTAANTTSCTASGGWSGAQLASGSADVQPASSTTYSLACSGAGGSVSQSITVTVTGGSVAGCAGSGPFPLRVEAGKRYLIDCSGKPFLMQGDAAWSLVAQLDITGVRAYLDDRKAKGFNTILVNLIEATYADRAPATIAGVQPFNTPRDFSTPNDAYFNYAATVIGEAQSRGILVLLAPAYLGCCNDGWLTAMQASGSAKLSGYGKYLAGKFGSYKNILWVEGGDYTATGSNLALVDALATGIDSVLGSSTLQTYHAQRGTAGLAAVNPATYSWFNVNTIYTGVSYGDIVSDGGAEYTAATMPFFLVENNYENPAGGPATPGLSRWQAWQADLSGTTGQVMGNSPIWFFCAKYYAYAGCPNWQSFLGSDGAKSMPILQNFMTARSWTSLQPDFSHAFLTSDSNTSVYPAVAAVAQDGSYAVAYTPGSGTLTFTLDPNRFTHNSYAVSWYDPTDGNSVAIKTLTPGSGPQSFATPRPNDGGANDWALIFQGQ
ncbi:MAG: DUF4038 domain-containing protein [Proteobacteria bacterium]|nr:DUF4038 domain-containing protein [Pseudomonadota bacterium]